MVARLRAFGIHFSASASVIALFLCVVFFIWYPYPYYEIYSTWDVIKIVAGVDVILGPLLTLVVFNRVKKAAELRRDLSVIVLLQIIALGWGVYVTYSVRPVFMVFSNGVLYSLTKKDVDVSQLSHKELEPGLFQPPALVYVKPPKNSEEYRQMYMDIINNSKPELMLRPRRYLPINDHLDRIYRFSLNTDVLRKNTESAKLMDAFVEQHGGRLNDYAFYKLKGPNTFATLALNKNTGRIAGLINKVTNKKPLFIQNMQ